MKIRPIEPKDLPKIKELQQEYEWTFDADFIDGFVAVDDNDAPVMFTGAWKIAEVHCLLDKQWSTPGARLAMLGKMHDAMEHSLKQKGYKTAATWFDERMKRFCRRLEQWGWIRSNKSSWIRSIH